MRVGQRAEAIINAVFFAYLGVAIFSHGLQPDLVRSSLYLCGACGVLLWGGFVVAKLDQSRARWSACWAVLLGGVPGVICYEYEIQLSIFALVVAMLLFQVGVSVRGR